MVVRYATIIRIVRVCNYFILVHSISYNKEGFTLPDSEIEILRVFLRTNLLLVLEYDYSSAVLTVLIAPSSEYCIRTRARNSYVLYSTRVQSTVATLASFTT
jgi:hypothetical protein